MNKLVLHRETLEILSESNARQIAGGNEIDPPKTVIPPICKVIVQTPVGN